MVTTDIEVREDIVPLEDAGKSINVSNRTSIKERRTIDRQDAFLDCFRGSGTIRKASLQSGVSRVTVGRWLADTDFRARFEDVKCDFREQLEEDGLFSRLKEPNCPPLIVIFALKGAWPEKYGDHVKPSESKAADLLAKLEGMDSRVTEVVAREITVKMDG